MANNEMIRLLCKVRKECNPNLNTCGVNWRHNCILHKYLLCVNPPLRFYGANCVGGYICEGIQKMLGLKATNMCADIHKNVYNIIKRGIRETKI